MRFIPDIEEKSLAASTHAVNRLPSPLPSFIEQWRALDDASASVSMKQRWRAR
jgi:hypothetical protein